MSDLTDFFPAASGGGVLKQHRIIASGTLDLTTLGIADNATIGLFLVGGGTGGDQSNEAGSGGQMWRGSTTLGTAGTVTVTIGAGGPASGNGLGGSTSISGGGLSSTIFTGTSAGASFTPGIGSPGYVRGGYGGLDQGATPYLGSAGIDGYGKSGSTGGGSSVFAPPANTGQGGDSRASGQIAGASGIVIIYYN